MKKNRFGMKFFTGALMLTGLIMTASAANAQRIGFGVGVAVGPSYYAPPPAAYAPPPVVAYAPAAPYPGYVWTNGHYNPYGVWVNGFWGPRFGYRGFYGRGFAGGRAFVGGRGFVAGRGFAGGRAFVGGRGHR